MAVRSAACASVAAAAPSAAAVGAAASARSGDTTGRTKMLLLLIADSQPASHSRQAAANSGRHTPTLIRVPPGTKHPSQELSERWLIDCRYRRFCRRARPGMSAESLARTRPGQPPGLRRVAPGREAAHRTCRLRAPGGTDHEDAAGAQPTLRRSTESPDRTP